MNQPRNRHLLMYLTAFVVLLCARFATADAPESAEMSDLRKEMRHRQRRVIYNNDGNEIFITRLSSPQDFLKQRIEPALGTQLDTIIFSSLVTTLYDHDTNVGERWDDMVDATKSTNKHALNGRANMRMLRKAGADCLSLVVDRCHEAGVEVFWSHRINDVHDSILHYDHLLSQWKRKHPEFLMGTPEDARKYPMEDPRFWWSTLDFEKKEVRDYLFRITEEVCQRYPVDGIEIDYFRAPMFFRPNLTDKQATPEQVGMMTGFQRRITEMARREGTKRGRPILVAVRVPMTKVTCRHVGIDIETWLAEDLVDLLVTGGGYLPFTMPTKELTELGHAHDVPVYPTISASGMKGRTAEGWRGAASNAWSSHADGIYLFNIFPGAPNHWAFTTLGDGTALAAMDKIFAIDNQGCRWGNMRCVVVQSQRLCIHELRAPDAGMQRWTHGGCVLWWRRTFEARVTQPARSKRPKRRRRARLYGANTDGLWTSRFPP